MFETYYLGNLAFTMAYGLALIIYLGRHAPENPRTGTIQRWLIWSVAWAFFDVFISFSAITFPPATVFQLYRWLSFLFLLPPGFIGEVILVLIRPVTWRDRAWLYGLPLCFYLAALLEPDWIGVRLYGVAYGAENFNLWFQSFLGYNLVILVILLVRLARDTREESDPDAKAEKKLLVWAGVITLLCQGVAQGLMALEGSHFPAFANIAVTPFAAAIYWGASRFGKVVSPRTLYQATVQAVPVGLAHLQAQRIVWANPTMATLLSYNHPVALYGLKVKDLFRPFLVGPRAARRFLDDLNAGRVQGEEVVITDSRQGQVPVLMSSSPVERGDPSRGVLLVASDLTHLKSMQSRLQHSEARYRNLVEQATELIAVLQDRICVFANSAVRDVLGWEPEEVVGREPEMFVHPEDITNLMEAYERRISGQSHSEVLPYRIFTRDGRLKWMELATRVVDWEGRPALQVFFRDITERKKAEEERSERLNRVERQQEAIVEVASTPSLVEGDFQNAARRITELCAQALEVDRASIWLFNPAHSSLVTSDLYVAEPGRHLNGEELQVADCSNLITALEAERAVDAGDVYLDARVAQLRFSYLEPNDVGALLGSAVRLRGRMVGMVCLEHTSGAHDWSEDELAFVGGVADQVAQALTNAERKKAQAALQESEERFRHLFDSISDLIYTHDEKGRLLSVNQAVVRLLGYSREELLGRPMSDFMTTKAREAFGSQYLHQLLEQGQSEGVAVLVAKDQSLHSVEYRNLLVAKDGVPYVSGSGREITQRLEAERELKQLQERLIQAQKMEAVGNLASGIAHDFNNILQGVSGYVQMLSQKPQADPVSRKYLDEVDSAVGRAAELVRRLLTFGRKAQAELRPVDLNREVTQAIRILERTIPKMVMIELELAPELMAINGDPNQLEQVIMNLVTNARDAMPQGGILTIATGDVELDGEFCRTHPGLEPGAYVRLEVRDQGQGMDKETVSHVFEPFYTTKEVGAGTGLGLFTVYGIVESHAGYISCDSALGQGTIFTIYLPAKEEKAAIMVPQDPGAGPVEGGSEAILLVDDEEAILEVVRDVLEQHGYSVLTADSGEGALELFGQEDGNVDLVILDLGMPGMGGDRCLELLREQVPEVKVVVATGYAGTDKRKEILSAGASGFISKPYRLDSLLRTVRQILDRPQGEPVQQEGD
ncbi:MAG: PAS domain S-box protein [Deltaproteobacteria bacterium]|nr:PAS domain S-box protein [Deltaproteobacteria bacterium]